MCQQEICSGSVSVVHRRAPAVGIARQRIEARARSLRVPEAGLARWRGPGRDSAHCVGIFLLRPKQRRPGPRRF